MEPWREQDLERELATTPEERLQWLTKAVRFAWEAASPETREIYELACRGELNPNPANHGRS